MEDGGLVTCDEDITTMSAASPHEGDDEFIDVSQDEVVYVDEDDVDEEVVVENEDDEECIDEEVDDEEETEYNGDEEDEQDEDEDVMRGAVKGPHNNKKESLPCLEPSILEISEDTTDSNSKRLILEASCVLV